MTNGYGTEGTQQEALAAIDEAISALVQATPPDAGARQAFLEARFDAGLAWIHFPVGVGGLGLPRALQRVVEERLEALGAPNNAHREPDIGLGMVAPTLVQFGTVDQQRRYLRPLWSGEEVWCQLFSEPGAGSDLAGLSTRAARDDAGSWRVTGQKVWTSNAHNARWGILLARTDPDVPKHRGLTLFVCDMEEPGIEIRPLRLLTGDIEFNEVFLDDVRVLDANRVGEVGDGWRVAQTTLSNERVAIGGKPEPREGGLIGLLADAWRDRPPDRTNEMHVDLLRLWVEAEVQRVAAERMRQRMVTGEPGPEGSAIKLAFAEISQRASSLELELNGSAGCEYDDWSAQAAEGANFTGRTPGYRYLRARGNSIEGGTSEILRNIIAERVLGLPREPRTDGGTAWKDLVR